MRLIILTQYDHTGASSRIRIYNFLALFRAAGMEVTVRPLLTRESNEILDGLATIRNPALLGLLLLRIAAAFLKRYRHVVEAWRYDVVLVQKDVLPFGLRRLLLLGQKHVLYDFDDAIWMTHPSAGKSRLVQAAAGWYRRRCLDRILGAVRGVVVDNGFLAAYARRFCPSVTEVSAPIDTALYRPAAARQPRKEKVLGWIGSPGTTYLLQELMPSLELLGLDVPLRLLNVGGSPVHSTGIAVENIPWSVEAELAALHRMDAGLMPLNRLPFNEGKLGYKIVQYLAAGVPVLASDAGLNPLVVKDGETGLIYRAGDSGDFARQAKRVLLDPSTWERMGRAARIDAEERYDLKVASGPFIEAIRAVAGERGAEPADSPS
jgi:glycosyltransferase involved in cell wall biosynthesis